MGKKVVLLFVFFFVFLSVGSSLEINSRKEYSSEESVLITVSGNFVTPVLREKISLYRGQARSAADIGLEIIEGVYHIYLNLEGKNPGNYSIQIEDVEYLEGNKKVKESIVIPFRVNEEIAKFSVSPLAIPTSKNFTIYVRNLMSIGSTVKLKTSNSKKIYPEKESYSIRPGERKQIKVVVNPDEEMALEKITVSMEGESKEIFAYVERMPEERKDGIRRFSFEREKVSLNLSTNSEKSYFIYLENAGDYKISNITVQVSDDLREIVDVSPRGEFSLDKNESIKIDIYVKTPNTPGKFNGYLVANGDSEMKEYLYLNFEVIQGYIPKNANEENPFSNYGDAPPENRKLIDEDGENKSSVSKIIGWVIVVILIAIIAWFFLKKYRGEKRSGIRFPSVKKR